MQSYYASILGACVNCITRALNHNYQIMYNSALLCPRDPTMSCREYFRIYTSGAVHANECSRPCPCSQATESIVAKALGACGFFNTTIKVFLTELFEPFLNQINLEVIPTGAVMPLCTCYSGVMWSIQSVGT